MTSAATVRELTGLGANGRDSGDVSRALASIWPQYPPDMISAQRDDVDRIAFHLGLVLSRVGRKARVWDIGGGVGMFSLGCAALGMETTVVDDFGDQIGAAALELHKRYGVRVIQRDMVKEGLGLEGESADAVTCFGSAEHWHGSPKNVLRAARNALRPNGLMVLNLPNCVDIGKRISTLFGTAQWSSMQDWYESAVFRSHVREASVDDLVYIAHDLGLRQSSIVGRNWGRISALSQRSGLGGLLAKAADRLLRVRPALCSELYLSGLA